ncbi:MAG: phosphoribosylformylglycinamidine cyclo-ligase [Planctomycetota bacterium]|nr:phosphoribosylformylglycinamidine cyclo-ligase [Planctomycetota bacterium]
MGGLSYRDAGVDIDKKMAAVGGIGALVRSTFTPGVLHELGSFGGMFSGRFEGLEDPILVATNDGVGTKVRAGVKAGRVRGLGQDIVNHCVDDILVQGAEPLFFLDYFASSVLEPAVFNEVIEGIAIACKEAGAALLGGETAEMPGVYQPGEFDIVGCIVGVVDRSKVWPRGVKAGDALIGVRSDGLHTNGFSLVNRLIERDELDLDVDPGPLGESLGDALLRPHRSYLPAIRALRTQVDIHGLAHITGGGLQDNLPRVLPEGVGAEVDRGAWTPNKVFSWLVETAGMDHDESYHVFNMGCALVVIVDESEADKTIATLTAAGEEAWRIGGLVEGAGVTFTA